MGKIKLISIIFINKNKIDRFNLNDINFFNLFYKSKFVNIFFIIKYISKNIFYRDIYIFINRVKNIIRVKNNILLR